MLLDFLNVVLAKKEISTQKHVVYFSECHLFYLLTLTVTKE